MLPSTLKYLYSVEPVRMHFPAKQPCTNDTVCNAAIQHCTRLFRGKMHSDWFNGIEILQGRWQHGEKVGKLLSQRTWKDSFNPLKPELNPICYLLALLGAHPILHVSRIRVNPFLTSGTYMSHPAGPICHTCKKSLQVRWDNNIPLFLHAAIYLEVSLFRWTSQNAFSHETAVYNVLCAMLLCKTRKITSTMGLDWDLLQDLECPACLEYMASPIEICENRHNICGSCKARL